MQLEKNTKKTADLPQYTIGEEIAHSILHGAGTLAAIAGFILLILKTGGFLEGERAGSKDIGAAVIFSVTMIALFLASTLYHAIQPKKIKHVMRNIDHMVVVAFIAGTSTPFSLSGLERFWGWGVFILQWFLALIAIILNIIGSKAFRKFEVTAYIIMGWVLVGILVPLMHTAPMQSIILLIVGGVVYTAGTIWYRKKNIRGTHIIWHAFVLAGAICHWFSIWFLY